MSFQIETVNKISNVLVDLSKALGIALKDNKIQFGEWGSIGFPLLRVPAIVRDRKLLPNELKLLRDNQEARFQLVSNIKERFGVAENQAEQLIQLTLSFYYELDNYIEDVTEIFADGQPPFSRKLNRDLGEYFADLCDIEL